MEMEKTNHYPVDFRTFLSFPEQSKALKRVQQIKNINESFNPVVLQIKAGYQIHCPHIIKYLISCTIPLEE